MAEIVSRAVPVKRQRHFYLAPRIIDANRGPNGTADGILAKVVNGATSMAC